MDRVVILKIFIFVNEFENLSKFSYKRNKNNIFLNPEKFQILNIKSRSKRSMFTMVHLLIWYHNQGENFQVDATT